MESRTIEEIEAMRADLNTRYWVLDGDELVTKMSSGAISGTRYYAHTDPAGTVYWSSHYKPINKGELNTYDGWRSDAPPTAEAFL